MFLGAQALAALGIAAMVSWRDPRLLAPGLCLAFHFALHWLYGREYVIYAPHWHGLLVATLVAGVWNGGHARRALAIASGLLAAALLVNNLAVLHASYEEIAWGLGTERRDLRGNRMPQPTEPDSYSR